MRPDVIDLRNFYLSPLGQVVRRLVGRKIRQLWPELKNFRLLGLGYATPYLGPFRAEAERVVSFMPLQQGVIQWPREGPGLVGLVDEYSLPLADASIDRLIWVHGLENTTDLDKILQEIWRVLTSTGKLMVVVPSRSGLWARTENTPFGYGHPYSDKQLNRLFRDNGFTPGERLGALYMPPSKWRLNLKLARAFENMGEKWWGRFCGVRLMEAEKQVFALNAPKEQKVKRRPVILPAARPVIAGRQARIEPVRRPPSKA
ncbi:MAG: methyltransferase domain-containing protein [Alphaproteobacteria bacterium]|nr:MAG: methyltransferase domain-containing protein [Alphaproteobacteria bacterium]